MSEGFDHSLFYLKPICRELDSIAGKLQGIGIPSGDGPQQSAGAPQSSQEERTLNTDDCLLKRESERKRLLTACGYDSERLRSRADEVDRCLYFKPAFISRNLSGENNAEALGICLADQEVLFTYSDENYWKRKVSSEAVSARRVLGYKKEERRGLYKNLNVWDNTTFSGQRIVSDEDRALHIALLERITNLAAENHQSLKQWVEKNIYRAVPDNDERMAVVNTRNLRPIDIEHIREIIDSIIPDQLCLYFLPNSKADQKADQNLELFRNILSEFEAKITAEFCRTFTNYVLPEYMEKISLATDPQYRPGHVLNEAKVLLAAQTNTYLCRLDKFQQLYVCYTEEQVLTLNLGIINCFSFRKIKNRPLDCEIEIAQAIQDFLLLLVILWVMIPRII